MPQDSKILMEKKKKAPLELHCTKHKRRTLRESQKFMSPPEETKIRLHTQDVLPQYNLLMKQIVTWGKEGMGYKENGKQGAILF